MAKREQFALRGLVEQIEAIAVGAGISLGDAADIYQRVIEVSSCYAEADEHVTDGLDAIKATKTSARKH